jgi:hypothetical protein
MQHALTHGTTATVMSGCCPCDRRSPRFVTVRRNTPMPRTNLLAIIVVMLGALAMSQTAPSPREKIAIVGATLIDVSDYGRSTNDIADSVVLIDDGKTLRSVRHRTSRSHQARSASTDMESSSFPVSSMASAPFAARLLAMPISMKASLRCTCPHYHQTGAEMGSLRLSETRLLDLARSSGRR